MNVGRSVKLYLADGKSTGILTAEIMNWTGHVLAAPRTRFEGVLSRLELKRTGVYLLIGPDDDGSDLTKVYVGEGDEIGKRLYAHNKDKEFWERFVAVTSKDMNLTKAHVRYLEGRLLTILTDAKKAKIENKDMPQFDLLPEADIADMEAFLTEIQLVFPVIGIDFFRKPTLDASKARQQSMPEAEVSYADVRFELSNIKAGICASAREDAGDFIVEEGSIGAFRESVSFNEKIKFIRDEALETGRISKTSKTNFQLEQDISFNSPSAAAVFLFGTSRNGRTDWLIKGEGSNYGTWKNTVIEKKLHLGG